MNFLTKKLVSCTDRMCRVCGGPVVYKDTKIKTARNGKIKITGRSCNTEKVVNGHKYTLSVCEKCLFDKFDIEKTAFNVMCESTKFAFDITDEDYFLARSKYSLSEDKFIEKYGEEGKRMWSEYRRKQSITNTFEYKHDKYGWTEEQFRDYNKSRAVTKKNMIKKYGEKAGLAKYNEYINKQKMTKSWDYMVKTYGIERAREINRSKVVTKQHFIEKYGEKDGTDKWIDHINNGFGVSKISQLCFDEIDGILSENHTTHYMKKDYEKSVVCGEKVYHLDYYIEDLNICIEFNGSRFHADPRIFSDNEHCNPFSQDLTAKQIRENDMKRYKDLYIFNKIKTFVIWELDYSNDDWSPEKFIIEELKLDIY